MHLLLIPSSATQAKRDLVGREYLHQGNRRKLEAETIAFFPFPTGSKVLLIPGRRKDARLAPVSKGRDTGRTRFSWLMWMIGSGISEGAQDCTTSLVTIAFLTINLGLFRIEDGGLSMDGFAKLKRMAGINS